MFCPGCGKEIRRESRFCTHCGAPLAATPAPGPASHPAASAGYPGYPNTSQAGASPPTPGAPGHPAGGQAALTPQQKRSATIWLLVIVGVLIASIAALIIIFLAARGGGGKEGGSGNGTTETTTESEEKDVGDVEKVVAALFDSLEKKDLDALLRLMEPAFLARLEEEVGTGWRQKLTEYFMALLPSDLKIEVREMDTTINGDKARVKIADGTLAFTDEYGSKTSEDASGSELGRLELVRIGGRWYLAEDALLGIGMTVEGIEEFIAAGESEGEKGKPGECGQAGV